MHQPDGVRVRSGYPCDQELIDLPLRLLGRLAIDTRFTAVALRQQWELLSEWAFRKQISP